jgi:hypothetical protein
MPTTGDVDWISQFILSTLRVRESAERSAERSAETTDHLVQLKTSVKCRSKANNAACL